MCLYWYRSQAVREKIALEYNASPADLKLAFPLKYITDTKKEFKISNDLKLFLRILETGSYY